MAESQQWAPSYTKDQTRKLIKSYDRSPNRFNENLVSQIRQHAYHHNVPFYEGDFSLFEAVKQIGAGFIEGFTTLNVSPEHPDNEYEGIARSVGHLIGFAPGILAGPAKYLGMKTGSQAALGAAKALQGKKGIPLYVSEKYITPKASEIASTVFKTRVGEGSKAFQAAKEFLTTPEAKHIAEGAFNLGTASALSTWQGGVDAMLEGFMGGAIAGGVFRTIGNRINLQDPQSEKFARGLAGSLFMGLPATMRGATMPEQVYEYLMGAYFGGSEKPWTVAKAAPIAQEIRKEANKSNDPYLKKTYDPEQLYDKWETLEPEVKKEVSKMTSSMAGGTPEYHDNIAYAIMEGAQEAGLKTGLSKTKGGADVRTAAYKLYNKQEKATEKAFQETAKKIMRGIRMDDTDPLSEYIMTTGAKGTQTYAAKKAAERGLTSLETRFAEQGRTFGKPSESFVLSRDSLSRANENIRIAVQSLNDKGIKTDLGSLNEYSKDAIRRDAVNIGYSKSVVIIDNLNPSMNAVTGKRKYVAQLGVDVKNADGSNKEVWVFQPTEKQWNKYDYSKQRFVNSAETPDMRARIAFFGAERLPKAGKTAIDELFVKYDKFGFKEQIKEEIDKKADILPEPSDVRDAGIFHRSMIDNKMSFFMRHHIEPSLKKMEGFKDRFVRNQELSRISKEAGNLLESESYIQKGSKRNRSEEWADALQEKLPEGVEVSAELRGKMRQWIAHQNQGEPVRHIITDGKIVEIADPNSPYTMAGKNKLTVEPPKPFDDIYRLRSGKDEPALATLDHLTYKGKDYDLSRFNYASAKLEIQKLRDQGAESISLNNMINQQKSIKKEFIANVIKEMKKKDMHPLGGVGDKDKIMFVKYHPDANKINLNKLKLPESIYKYAKEAYGMTKLEHDKMMKSIMAYSQDMNGMSIKEMVAGSKKGNFIGNAVAENKRMQIWMTNGLSGDKDFIRKLIPNLSKVKVPNYKFNSKLKSLAATDKNNNISIRPNITKEQFLNYISGNDKSASSKQKQLVFKNLEKEGYDGERIDNLIKNNSDINKFLALHEQSHVANKDIQVYWKQGRDLLTKDKIAIETRATLDAFKGMEGGGNYKASLIADPKKVQNILDKLNIQLPQHVDGAIIATDAVVDAINRDAGVPYSGQNKSFIISKNAKGTILGKYMIHKAGPDLSPAMEKANNGEGINFLMMDSAIKQRGNRTPGDYVYKKGEPLELVGGAKEIIEINPGDLKYSQSVVNDSKMLGVSEHGKTIGVTLAKQMFTNQHPDMYSPVEQKVINDFYNGISQDSFNGKKEINDAVDAYIKKPSNKLIDNIVENVSEIGIPKIQELLKAPGREKLAQEVLLEVIKADKEAIDGLAAEGEISGTNYTKKTQQLVDFYSTADNIIKNLATIKEGYPMFFDKYTKDYVLTALDRYAAERVLRPKMKNSIMARMRPYDKALYDKFPDLNTRDDIFYLGDLYKKTPMFTNIPGLEKTDLGRLWAAKTNPKYKNFKKEFDEIFEAINVRVPQDSPSGAQVKKFKGFTGIEDHGVLSHGRSMEAQGGADLDGDESFIYFGGRNRDGVGEGMKQSWKEMFKAQKKEFYTEDGKSIKDAKDQYRETIVLQPGEDKLVNDFLNNVQNNPLAKYSPAVRMFSGEQTAASRGMMGPVVSMTSHMRAAWSSLRASKSEFDVLEQGEYTKLYGRKIKPIEYRILLTPNEPNERQRDLTKALINFTADPANEVGLIPITQMKNLLESTYFTKQHQQWNSVKKKYVNIEKKKGLYAKNKEPVKNRYNEIKSFNDAFFGRNYEADRAWSQSERYDKAKLIEQYSQAERNTATLKFAHTMKDVDMRITLFDRINRKAVTNVYQKQKEFAKSREEFKKEFKDLLGRTKLFDNENKYINWTFKNLYENGRSVEDNINNLSLWGLQLKNRLIKEVSPGAGFEFETYFEKTKKDSNNPEHVKDFLVKFHNDAQDYLSNGLHTMATFERFVKIYDTAKNLKHELSPELMSEIRSKVGLFNKINSMQYANRSKKGDFVPAEQLEIIAESREIEKMHEKARKLGLIEFVPEAENRPGKSTKLVDQASLDKQILAFKESLPNESARDMFDTLLIGSFRSPELNKVIQKLKNMYKKDKDSAIRDLITELSKAGAKTNTTKLAFDSKVVNPKNIQAFFRAKNKFYRHSTEDLSEKEIKKVEEAEPLLDKLVDKKNIRLESLMSEEFDAYEGIKPSKLEIKPEDKKVIAELISNLKFYPDSKGKDLGKILSGAYTTMHEPFVDVPTKSFNQMNTTDFKLLNRYFRFVRSGNFMQKMEKNLSELKKAGVKKRWYALFPRAVNAEQMSRDMKFLESEGYINVKDGMPGKKIATYKPTYYGEVLQNWIGRTHDLAYGVSENLTRAFYEKFEYLKQTDKMEDGDAIWRLAVRKHELKLGNETKEKVYEQNWKESIKRNNWSKIRDKVFMVDLGKGKKKYTGYELVDYTMDKISETFGSYHEIITGKTGALNKYIMGFYDKANTQPILDYKSFLNDLNTAYKTGRLLKSTDSKVNDLLGIGIDGMRHMTRSMFIDLLPPSEYSRVIKGTLKKISAKKYFELPVNEQRKWRADKEAKVKDYEDLVIESTGFLDGYFPHYFSSTKRLKKAKKQDILALNQNSSLTKAQKQSEMEKIIQKYKMRTGDWDFADYKVWEKMDADLFGKAVEGVREKVKARRDMQALPSVNQRFGNMFKRDNHMGGWLVEPEAVETYIKNLTNTYFRQMANMVSRHTLHQMREHLNKRWVSTASKKDKQEARNLVEGLVTFWRKYASDAMGNPAVVTSGDLKMPGLNIQGTPYAFWADNVIAEKVNKIGYKLGLIKEMKPINKQKRNDDDIILGGYDAYDMRRWSNLEGKYQLATLMTHPKTMINNIFGGAMHTFMSVGYQPFKNARSIEYLKSINPKWRTMEDISRFVADLGIQPELLQHEFGMHKEFRQGKGKAFASELVRMSKEIENIKEVDITGLANKYGISKSIMNKAAKFMTIPERRLRQDAFMSHYVKAWERFGGAITDVNNPILVEMAKKGVQATQFLYNAPFRPAFARTALGKVMSRFQLWSWNAVRFRNDVRKQARLYGFEPGTEAMKRFERTMTTDLFVLALSSVFMYSIFEQTLPAPWNWLQDTSDWLFGDEKERDRAFFGTYPSSIAPLQMITPPIARLPISVLRQWAEDDYTKLSDYYIWTMLPFGRIMRDIAHPETGLINNPMRFPEKLTGIPLTGLAKERKRLKETDYVPPSPGKSLIKD